VADRVGVGDPAPDFTLPAHAGGKVRLRDLLGRKAIVLFFYPKDESPGCTAEACAFRDSYAAFTDAGAEVVGISGDSVRAHRRFAAAHRLPFILLSDRDGAVRRAYGAERLLGLWRSRITFVIDRGGIVRHVFESQIAAVRHVAEALEALAAAE
jgi:peroxiredoxin Q/BCP